MVCVVVGFGADSSLQSGILCMGLNGQIKALSASGSSAHIWVLLMCLRGIISFLSPFLENVILSTDFLRRFSYAQGKGFSPTSQLPSL